jgi:hypothetical protein
VNALPAKSKSGHATALRVNTVFTVAPVYMTFSTSVKQKRKSIKIGHNKRNTLLPLHPIQRKCRFHLAVEQLQKHHHIFLAGK